MTRKYLFLVKLWDTLVNTAYFKDAHGPGNLSEGKRMSISQGIIVFFQGNLFFNLK